MKRKNKFQRFLHAVARSEEFKSSTLFLYFLMMPSSESWQTTVKKEEKIKFGDLSQLTS